MLLCFCSSPFSSSAGKKKEVLFREECKLALVHLQDNYWFLLYLNLARSADICMVGGRGVELK